MVVSVVSLVDVLAGINEGFARVDAGIHQGCICGENTTTNQER